MRHVHIPRTRLDVALGPRAKRLHGARYGARVRRARFEETVAATEDDGVAEVTYPKIELHVHLEATVAPQTLFEIAHRNDYPLPIDTVEGLAALYHYTDFEHFIRVWTLTSNVLQRYDDFRQVVVAYAGVAKQHGAVYLEGIFSPNPRVARGGGWDEIFRGYCDGCRRWVGACESLTCDRQNRYLPR